MAELKTTNQEPDKCNTKEAIEDAHARIDNSEQQLNDLRKQLKENTEITAHLLAQTEEMVGFYTAMKGAFKVLNWIGAVAKPVSAILAMVAASAAIWSSMKGGG